ncbi:MAG: Gfo/Idh/MocA family oxidoreductase [Pseudonocardia sp.]|nr:Gfo/Idh/MocA family oxidoreductase [Pseudonocardia sp.]
MRRDDLDVVSVATPTGLHREIALAALDAGKAVLCEKPLAGDPAEAREMVKAAAASGRPTGCCFENRWSADWLAIEETVRDGLLGRPYLARVSRSASYWHPSRRPLQSAWMYDRAQGGGYLAGMLVHDLDYLCTLLGPPEAVCAEVHSSEPVRILPEGGELHVTADDTSALLMRMASGALAVLSVSTVGAHTDHVRIELLGADGTVVGDGTLRETRYAAGRADGDGLAPLDPSPREPVAPGELPGGLAGVASRAMALMLEDWAPAFDGADTPVPTFADGLLSLAIIDAAHRSAAGAGWVAVTP